MLLETSEEYLMKTERFGLRQFSESDLQSLYEIESNPTLKQYVGGPVREPEAEWIARVRTNILRAMVQFALIDRTTGVLAGRVSLGRWQWTKDEFEVQLILARQFVGRRLGEEACFLACEYAFTSLSAAAVWAVVDADHRASLELISRLDFTEEPQQCGEDGKRHFVLRSAA